MSSMASDRAKKRELVAEEAKANLGEGDFSMGEALRISWVSYQRADKELNSIIQSFQAKSGTPSSPEGVEGYRIARMECSSEK